MPDYYAMLEVPFTATLDQIKRSYRRLARQYHPDLNQEVADDRIKKLNEAYAILSDSKRRAAYDLQRLEAMRMSLLFEAIRRQREGSSQEPRMTWKEGVKGFFTELKREMGK